MTNFTRLLLALVPATVFVAAVSTVACSGDGGSSSGGSSSGGSSSGGSSSGGSSSGGSSSGSSSGGSSSGSSSGGHADCGAIAYFPPIVNVHGTAPACDATFTVIDLPDGSAIPTNPGAELCYPSDGGPMPAGCPVFDGGVPMPAECLYVLTALANEDTAKLTVDVSQTGYASATITDVVGGVGGCEPYVAPSTSSLTLEQVDAGPDAH